jgi:hypothetical protein
MTKLLDLVVDRFECHVRLVLDCRRQDLRLLIQLSGLLLTLIDVHLEANKLIVIHFQPLR